jgi:hypothetical protein
LSEIDIFCIAPHLIVDTESNADDSSCTPLLPLSSPPQHTPVLNGPDQLQITSSHRFDHPASTLVENESGGTQDHSSKTQQLLCLCLIKITITMPA